MIQPLWKTAGRFLRKLRNSKLKIELPYDPAVPPLDIYPEKTIIRKDTHAHSSIIYNTAKTWKQPKLSISRQTDNEDVV